MILQEPFHSGNSVSPSGAPGILAPKADALRSVAFNVWRGFQRQKTALCGSIAGDDLRRCAGCGVAAGSRRECRGGEAGRKNLSGDHEQGEAAAASGICV